MKTIEDIQKEIRQKFLGDGECSFTRLGEGPWHWEVSTHNLILGEGSTEQEAWKDAEKQCNEAIWIEKSREWITKDMATKEEIRENQRRLFDALPKMKG